MAACSSPATSRCRHTRSNGWVASSARSALRHCGRRRSARCSPSTGRGCGTSAPRRTAAAWRRCSSCSAAMPRTSGSTHAGSSSTVTPSSLPSRSACTTACTARPAMPDTSDRARPSTTRPSSGPTWRLSTGGSVATTSSSCTTRRRPGWRRTSMRTACARLWRCHIGSDTANSFTEEAWDFLEPQLSGCRTFVFSHAAFVPPRLAGADVWIIQPSIDPLAAKNRPLHGSRVLALLARIGLLEGDGQGRAPAVLGGAAPFSPGDPLVVQVSRWDRLKDMEGVLRGFADRLAGLGRRVSLSSDRPSTVSPTTRRGRGSSPTASLPGSRSPGGPATPSASSPSRWTTRWPTRSWSMRPSGTPASWCRRACRKASASPSRRRCGSPAPSWPRPSAGSSAKSPRNGRPPRRSARPRHLRKDAGRPAGPARGQGGDGPPRPAPRPRPLPERPSPHRLRAPAGAHDRRP